MFPLPYTDELPYCPYRRPCMKNPYLIIANKFVVHDCERQSNHYCPYYPGRRKLNMQTTMKSGHVLYDVGDHMPETTRVHVEEGGLAVCKRCGGGEQQLLDEACTGYPVVVTHVKDRNSTHNRYPMAHYEYIGRGKDSILGNPFHMERIYDTSGDIERTRVIEAFRVLLNTDRVKFEAAGKEIIDRFRHALLTDFGEERKDIELPDSPLWKRVQFLAQMNLERIVILECYCAPLACHGDVIANAIRYINKEAHNNAETNTVV